MFRITLYSIKMFGRILLKTQALWEISDVYSLSNISGVGSTIEEKVTTECTTEPETAICKFIVGDNNVL